MKHIFFIIALGASLSLWSCVDKDYDLSQIDTDGITIGNNESTFNMPLLKVQFRSSNICQNVKDGETSIMQLYKQINVWVPTTLPNGASYIDMTELSTNEQYRNSILCALFEQMRAEQAKRTEVCGMVVKQYRNELVEQLFYSPNPELSIAASLIKLMDDDEATEVLAELFMEFPNDMEDILSELSDEDLLKYDMEDVVIDIPALDISDDVKDMLIENLDPATVTEPENALYLFGNVTSDFPFMFHISPSIVNTQITLGDIYIDNQTTDIDLVRIFKEDVEVLFEGSQLIMPIKLDRYYPNRTFTDQSQIMITINLHKKGGLNL